MVQKVAVVQGLQAQVVKLQVALGLEGGAQAHQVELRHFFVQQLVAHGLLDVVRKVLGISGLHVRSGHVAAQHFTRNGVKQQTRRGVGVIGVLFDERAGGQDGGLEHLVHGHAVVQVAHGLGDDGFGLDVCAQAKARGFYALRHGTQVQRHALAPVHHMQRGRGGCGIGDLLGPLLGTAFAVQHIGARDFVVASAHQTQLHLVLHVFNVEGAAARARAHQRAHHLLGQGVDVFAHAGRRRALGAMHGQGGLHDGHGDLVGLKRHDCAVAANDLVARQGTDAAEFREMKAGRQGQGCGGGQGGEGLHGFLWLSVFL